jgi:hypothetical protein
MIGMPRVLSIPDSDDILVLDDAPDPPEYYQRVRRCRPDGTVAWVAAPPTSQPDDAWTPSISRTTRSSQTRGHAFGSPST